MIQFIVSLSGSLGGSFGFSLKSLLRCVNTRVTAINLFIFNRLARIWMGHTFWDERTNKVNETKGDATMPKEPESAFCLLLCFLGVIPVPKLD